MPPLATPVKSLKGVGESLARRLGRMGIETIEDLLGHYPRRYEDYSNLLPIRQIKPGPMTIRGQIVQIASRRAHTRRLSITEAIITDGTGTVKAVWFNQPFLARTFPPGSDVFISGQLEFRQNDLAIQSPAIEAADRGGRDTGRIVPVYAETEGLTSKQLRGLILPLLDTTDGLADPLPTEVIAANQLMPYGQALRQIHFPDSKPQLDQARRRLSFEELFFLIVTSLVIKSEIKTEAAPVIKFNPEIAKQFLAVLGFKLTDGQRAAAWQILQDLDRDVPMNRLLEGDVGSGKTVVAIMAAVMAMAAGYQVALMVPTEILARQHAKNVTAWLDQLGFRAVVQVGKQAAALKRQNQAAIAGGQANLIIGTQALLSGELDFANLGLVIVDEQHRFGVNQRQLLKQKAGRLPHLLSMTATPIPRSLALTVYGDLDISVIKELPPGRQPIETQVVRPKGRETAYQQVDRLINQGRQVFVVCPLIEESDQLGAKSAVAEAERLKASVFAHRRIGLLHGRLAAAEKQAVMNQFSAGELDILVATSVIEVGIDVPNAAVMMIEGADRFGLAALHQLRGRVGRGSDQSYCYILTDNPAPGILERLQALERSQDGFRLAQIDLEIRGPGQIYGLRQHGRLDLKLADISDTELVAAVRRSAKDFLQNADALVKYPQVTERINQLKTITSLD